MSHRPRLGNLLVDAQAKATADLLNAGWLEVRSGEPPENPEEAPDDASLLVKCQFADVAFGPPKDGVLVANKSQRAQAVRSGQPTWVRLTTASGQFVSDGTFGEKNANAVANVRQIVAGQFVDLTGYKHVIPKRL